MVTLTNNAVKYIKSLPEFEGGLRIAAVGGGCSGLLYKLRFEAEGSPIDEIFEQDGIKVLVDPKSLPYIKGLEIDYSSGLNGTGFTYKNPNAQKGCGCGSSFGV